MPFSVFYQFTSRFSFLHPHRLYTKIFARKYYISENQIRHFSDFKIFLFSLYSNGLFCRIIELIVILCGLLCCVHFTQRASTQTTANGSMCRTWTVTWRRNHPYKHMIFIPPDRNRHLPPPRYRYSVRDETKNGGLDENRF